MLIIYKFFNLQVAHKYKRVNSSQIQYSRSQRDIILRTYANQRKQRVDIDSVGCMVYVMVTSHAPTSILESQF